MGIRSIEVISIPVKDQHRAKEFYADKLGFVLDTDSEFAPGMRWVQLTPPEGGASITLITWNESMPPGSVKDIYLDCEDIRGTSAKLKEQGVTIKGENFGTPFGDFATFDDPDGNGWSLHQQPG
jgi:predicted enzyme related to lactoylglutathione lyase